ncbi:MAG: D-Ala-D-Ala carboxypeptidase family metallohydrolase [Bacteroidota bacterium]
MKRLVKTITAILTLILVSWGIGYLFVWQVRDFSYELKEALLTEDREITTKTEVDGILSKLKVVVLADLPQAYRKASGIAAAKYAKAFRGATFYAVPRSLLYAKVTGHTRIRDLVSRDSFFRAALFDQATPVYWRIDKRILYKVIDLRDALTAAGHDPDAFDIHHGFRAPRYNEQVGGASQSRHLYGEAVDLTIQDIDQDGGYTSQDKEIVLDLLERKVIRNGGGLGLYPGTRVVHMDVRGYRARWNSY